MRQVTRRSWLPRASAYIPFMSTLLVFVIVLAMAATAFVLVKGVVAMASGKDVGGVKQQKAMRQRVMYQALAIVFIVLLLMMTRGGN